MIKSEAIKSIALVFRPTAIENEDFHPMQGMFNVFLARYRSDNSLIPIDCCLPFPDEYPEYRLCRSYALRVFLELEEVKNAMSKILGRIAQSQGDNSRKSLTLQISKEAWMHIYRHSLLGCKRTVSMWRPKRLFETGARLRSGHVGSNDAQLIRWETVAELQELLSLLGEGVLCNVRKRAKRGKTKPLNMHDCFNVVTGSIEREAPFKRFTSNDGVDFIFDGDTTFRVTIRYRLYVHEGALSNVPCEYLKRFIKRQDTTVSSEVEVEDDHESDDDAYQLECGLQFQYQQRLYEVSNIWANGIVTCICTFPRERQGHEILLPYNDVTDAVEEYEE